MAEKKGKQPAQRAPWEKGLAAARRARAANRRAGKKPAQRAPWEKGLAAARRARAANRCAGKKRHVKGSTRSYKAHKVNVAAYSSYEAREKPRRRTTSVYKQYGVYNLDGAWAVDDVDGDGTQIAAGLRTKDEALRVARRRRARRRKGRRKAAETTKRTSGKRKSAKRVAAGRKAARTRKRNVAPRPRLGGLKPRKMPRRTSTRAYAYERRGRRHSRRGARENPLSGVEVLVGVFTGLSGFAAADVLDRFMATHPLQTSTTTGTNGQALYTDTPNTTGQYVGLFNGTAVLAPMDWQRWLAGAAITLIPMGLAFWPIKATSPGLRASLQTFAFGAGIRVLGKGLQDLASAMLSFTCIGQRLYDPEIRARALTAVNGNTSDATVTGFPSSGLGRPHPLQGTQTRPGLAPAAVIRRLGPGVGAPSKCTKCGKPGVAGCCATLGGCCPPPAAAAPPPQASTNPPSSFVAPTAPGAGVTGIPRSSPSNPYSWGDDAAAQ